MDIPTADDHFSVDRLAVEVYQDAELTGKAAAHGVAQCLRELLATKDRVRVIFAAAPSQDGLLAHLARETGIDWARIDAMDMDEYVGLAESDTASFSYYLREHLFHHVAIGSAQLIDGAANIEAEIGRFEALLEQAPTDVVCLGIGENGHVAFNEPWVADAEDAARVREVTLSHESRWQQVHDRCFDSIDDVPKTAITLTMSAILGASRLFVSVPGSRKASAVAKALTEPISRELPASLLRLHPDVHLFLDRDSAAGLRRNVSRAGRSHGDEC